MHMPHFDNGTLEVILYCVAALVLLFLGYRLGRFFGGLSASKTIARKEEERHARNHGGEIRLQKLLRAAAEE